MAKYTIELRTLIESGFPLFDFNYPFYNEEKRLEFQQHFIQHFYFYEIGCETAQRFKHYLIDKFNTVFPYYNELFRVEQIKYNELINYDVTEKYTKTNTGSISESATKNNTESGSTSLTTSDTIKDTTKVSGTSKETSKESISEPTSLEI